MTSAFRQAALICGAGIAAVWLGGADERSLLVTGLALLLLVAAWFETKPADYGLLAPGWVIVSIFSTLLLVSAGALSDLWGAVLLVGAGVVAALLYLARKPGAQNAAFELRERRTLPQVWRNVPSRTAGRRGRSYRQHYRFALGFEPIELTELRGDVAQAVVRLSPFEQEWVLGTLNRWRTATSDLSADERVRRRDRDA